MQQLSQQCGSLCHLTLILNQEAHVYFLREPRMGGWIRRCWICIWGAPDFNPESLPEAFENKGLGASQLNLGRPKNAEPTTTDPTLHSRPSDSRIPFLLIPKSNSEKKRKRAEYCSKSTFSNERLVEFCSQVAEFCREARRVPFATHSHNRTSRSHRALSPELGEGDVTHGG